MSFTTLWWSIFRIAYFSQGVFWGSVLCVWLNPPKDGNYAREFEGTLYICLAMLAMAWACMPFLGTTPETKQNRLWTDIEKEREEVWGQQSLEDFLETRRPKASSE